MRPDRTVKVAPSRLQSMRGRVWGSSNGQPWRTRNPVHDFLGSPVSGSDAGDISDHFGRKAGIAASRR